MTFPRRYLNEGEDIALEMRPHWCVLATPAIALALSIALALYASGRFQGTLDRVAVIPPLLLVVVAVGWLLVRFAKWYTTEFVVTTDRLIHRRGVLHRTGREIPLERLNDVSYHQTVFQRLVRSGDILVESGGERGQQIFSNFAHPQETQNLIHREIELAQARDADRMAGRRELSPLEHLDKLDELRQRGVISQAEFEVKKAKLLDRL